jgi:two-component system response regulator YesN
VNEDRKKQEQEQELENTLMEYALKDILESSETTPDNIKNRLQNLGFSGTYKWYSCAILEKNEKDSLHIREKYFIEIIKTLVNRYLNFCREKIVIPYSGDSAVLIMAHESEYKKLTVSMGKLRAELSKTLDVAVSIGMGRMYHKIEKIRQSFEEAQCALNYKIIKGLDCIILYDQICDIDLKPNLVSIEDIKRFESCIDNMDEKGYKLVIEEIFCKIEKEKDLSLKDLQLISLNLILSGIRKMSFTQIQLSEYLGKNIFTLESITKFQTTTQLKNWIFNMLKSMNELMLKNSIPEKQDVVEEAKKYINKNFNRNISLNTIAERFFINPYYFSQLFKKKTGENYQNYLIRLRAERAKKLLEETDLKIYEICELVGYSDISHFNKIFKRVIGITPSEYKRGIVEKD